VDLPKYSNIEYNTSCQHSERVSSDWPEMDLDLHGPKQEAERMLYLV